MADGNSFFAVRRCPSLSPPSVWPSLDELPSFKCNIHQSRVFLG